MGETVYGWVVLLCGIGLFGTLLSSAGAGKSGKLLITLVVLSALGSTVPDLSDEIDLTQTVATFSALAQNTQTDTDQAVASAAGQSLGREFAALLEQRLGGIWQASVTLCCDDTGNYAVSEVTLTGPDDRIMAAAELAREQLGCETITRIGAEGT